MPHLMMQATAYGVNNGFLENGERRPTKNAIFVEDNLLADIWVHLKPALAYSIEALYTLLVNPKSRLRKSLLSMEKCFKTSCSCLRTQLGACTRTRDLTLRILEKNVQT